jgi:hypothetical protein
MKSRFFDWLGVDGASFTPVSYFLRKFQGKVSATGTNVRDSVGFLDLKAFHDVLRPIPGRCCFLVEHFQGE